MWYSETFLNDCAHRVEVLIESEYDSNPFDYVDQDGDVSLREDTVFEKAVAQVVQEERISGYELFYTEMQLRVGEKVFDKAKEIIEDMVRNQVFHNPFPYMGSSESNF